jgi:hypothetical protein
MARDCTAKVFVVRRVEKASPGDLAVMPGDCFGY